jgi:hypothetical protein
MVYGELEREPAEVAEGKGDSCSRCLFRPEQWEGEAKRLSGNEEACLRGV